MFRRPVYLPDPEGAQRKLNELSVDPWYWFGIPNNCVSFVEELFLAGGADESILSNLSGSVAVKVAKFIFWGLLLTGCFAGAIFGFYVPLLLMFGFLDIGYEQALPWLLLSATVGMFAGGFGLGRMLKSRLKQ